MEASKRWTAQPIQTKFESWGGGGGGGGNSIVSVYIATFYSFARVPLSALIVLSCI